VPIVLVGGDITVGLFVKRLVGSLQKRGCTNVIPEIIKNCGHYVPEEKPGIMVELIEHYALQ
jgi:hypothetical protein